MCCMRIYGQHAPSARKESRRGSCARSRALCMKILARELAWRRRLNASAMHSTYRASLPDKQSVCNRCPDRLLTLQNGMHVNNRVTIDQGMQSWPLQRSAATWTAPKGTIASRIWPRKRREWYSGEAREAPTQRLNVSKPARCMIQK